MDATINNNNEQSILNPYKHKQKRYILGLRLPREGEKEWDLLKSEGDGRKRKRERVIRRECDSENRFFV